MEVRIGEPNPKQQEFFLARQRFIAYGGARAGGKSWAVRKKALLLGLNYPGIRMLLLRRTYPELRENHILPLVSELKGVAGYKETEKAFHFVNGSRLKFGYCDSERDVDQYQGQEYDIIFIDEATQFTEYQFSTLTACLRGTNGFPKRFYLTCNPGGVGHAWVKRLFVDRQYRGSENPADYCFIAAKVYDNQPFMERNPDYVKTLENLPDKVREAWLNGNWEVFSGQYFSMWNRAVHVLRPFVPPAHWRRYVTLDYGRDMLACYLIVVDEQGRAYVCRELYEGRDNGKGLNGEGHIVQAAVQRVKAMVGGEQVTAFYAPPDLWNKHNDTGLSTAQLFAERGIYLCKANNNRVQGWYNLAEWLRVGEDEQGQPTAKLRIFDCCPNLIRTLPQLQYDERNPNDCANEPHELTHGPDALRYFVAGRPCRAAALKPDDWEEPADEVNELLNFGR